MRKKLTPESLVVETFVTVGAPALSRGPETYDCDTLATTGGPWFCPRGLRLIRRR